MNDLSLTYERLNNTHLAAILPLAIDEFILGEPMMKGLGAKVEEFRPMMMEGIPKWLNYGLSVGAWYKKTRLVGVLLATKLSRGEDSSMWSAFKPTCEKTLAYVELEKIMESSVDVFGEDENVQFALEHNLLSVHPEFRKMGIGSNLAEKAETIGRENNCTMAIVEASGTASQNIFSKLGYSIKFEYFFSDFEINRRKAFDLRLMGNSTKNVILTKYL